MSGDDSSSVPSSCVNEKGEYISMVSSSSGGDFLDSSAIRLVTWNSYKGGREGWQEDLKRMSRETDIVALQEGYLTESLVDLLFVENLHWIIANAFSYKGYTAGTLTASKVKPDLFCSLRAAEPVINIPKSVLVTRYSLSGSNKKLLLVNMHMINFTFDLTLYREQLNLVAGLLEQHVGPYIITGDFNSWNNRRKVILDEVLSDYMAKRVQFTEDYRTTFMGNYVDYIFYNGLMLLNSHTEEVASSDHNPLFAVFRLPGD